MNIKMISLAAALTMVVAGCNENKVETKTAETAQPAVVATVPAESAQPAKVKPVSKVGEQLPSVEWSAALEMAKNGAIFVDVRNPPELKDGLAQGALNIPLAELKQRLAELPKDKELLIYCRSGRRSEVATHILMQEGYEKVHNVLGGFLAYPRD